ncbi:type II toxin-antitoxin system RelE/ParE family toxin [Tatumella citrea]|uniref:Diaminopimelate decarboxylase n=1 Tax=Tatumella citrea TaxID=53336 RepID=A0A1Y0L9Z8_TATCI|nr:type II toxin-antitoxin system RelE/ParE family toxin [Tatumella citrea]ARU94458.1 diaminopimelate decarboxylase [Tatumella citrea]ARU98497.1 diaminopimelate decarboxylase [Tatumella citrea]
MWTVITTDRFDHWLCSLSDSARISVLAMLLVLREKGPGLSRPYADTVKGSRYNNMKELRIQHHGDPIRAFYAFDLARNGIVLCAGNKVGNEKRFYAEMLPVADREFTRWLNRLK